MKGIEMPEFQYTSKKQMEPRPGVKYATDYYKQPLSEYRLLSRHVAQVATEINRICSTSPEWAMWCVSPLKAFPKTVGKYSLMDIVTDMLEQTIKEKDVPSGMLSRWNRLFHDTEWDIVMVTGKPARVKDTKYGDLFNV